MKPIAMFQHTSVGAPGSLLKALGQFERCVELIEIFDGQPVPEKAAGFAGLVFLGGHMSASDDLPWIAEEIALIQDAEARGIPVAGHCLGSQILALALGGEVTRNPQAEIGWGRIKATDDVNGRSWWGPYAGCSLETFQWHAETFSLAGNAVRLGSSEFCENQIVVVGDRHLLVQSHLEMTPHLIEAYVAKNGAQLTREHARGNPAVGAPEGIWEDIDRRTNAMEGILMALYARWGERLG